MMQDIFEKILFFSELEKDEQRSVEAEVALNPDLVLLLAETKSFCRLIERAHGFANTDDETIAYAVATRMLSNHTAPDPLLEILSRLEQALSKDATLYSRYKCFENRMLELEKSSDAVDRYQRLTGHPIASHSG